MSLHHSRGDHSTLITMVKLSNGPDIVMVQVRRKETKYHNENVGMQNCCFYYTFYWLINFKFYEIFTRQHALQPL